MDDSSAKRNDAHPPRPILTLRVGITGHRPKPARFPASAFDEVNRQLALVFEAIDAALGEQQFQLRDFYSDEPFRVRLVSGMAEGADQMAARARRKNWHVEAVLPFPRETYRRDFEKSAADASINVQAEFDAALTQADAILELPEVDESGKRDLGYGRLGAFLVRQIDLLVAVWDGEPEEGIGGTTEVIREALAAHVPVVWIMSRPSSARHAPNPRLIERIERDGETVAPDVDCTQGKLAAEIATIVSPPTRDREQELAHAPEEHGPSAMARLTKYMQETWPRATRSVLYDLPKRLAEGKPLRLTIPVPTPESRLKEWDPFFQDAPRHTGLEDRLRSILLPRYIWADQLAIHFANQYRSAYIFCYLLSALVVFIALLGVFTHLIDENWQPVLGMKAVLVAVELVFIWLIVRKYRKGRSHRWHERWLEYRALAEMLRDSFFLAYFAEYGRIQRTNILKSSSSAWFLWYLRATLRELGLPTAVFDGTYQDALLTAVHDHLISGATGQIKYHRENADALRRINVWLRGTIDFCFLATLVILFAFLMIFLFPIFGAFGTFLQGTQALVLASGVTFCAALFPAVGAAIAGIRETADFESFGNRSAQTVVALENLVAELREAKVLVSIDDTSNVLFSIARILTEDLAAWHSLYGGKRLNLPL